MHRSSAHQLEFAESRGVLKPVRLINFVEVVPLIYPKLKTLRKVLPIILDLCFLETARKFSLNKGHLDGRLNRYTYQTKLSRFYLR